MVRGFQYASTVVTIPTLDRAIDRSKWMQRAVGGRGLEGVAEGKERTIVLRYR